MIAEAMGFEGANSFGEYIANCDNIADYPDLSFGFGGHTFSITSEVPPSSNRPHQTLSTLRTWNGASSSRIPHDHEPAPPSLDLSMCFLDSRSPPRRITPVSGAPARFIISLSRAFRLHRRIISWTSERMSACSVSWEIRR